METRAGYVAVGGFVLLLLAGLVLFVLWLGRFQSEAQFAYYDIFFRGSVTGLQIDNPVRYRGVQVGRVVDMGIDEENIEQVRVTVEVRRGTPVKTDSVASLELQGITGVAYVQIAGGTREAPALPERADRPYPVIPSVPSRLEEIFEGAPDLVNRLNELVGRATLLFSEENVAAIGATLQNLERVTGALAATSGDMTRFLAAGAGAADQVRSMTAEFELLAKELRAGMGSLQSEGMETVEDLRETAAAFRGVARELERLIAENREPIRDFTVTGFYELTQLLTEVRLLVASMSRVSAQIERDPARFLFGDRQRGFEAQ